MFVRPALKCGWGLLLLAVAAACDDAQTSPESAAIKEAMVDVLDPAADVLWASAGFVLTTAGERSLAPTSEEGWAEVRANARTVMASGESLTAESSLPDEPDAWIEYARGMTRIAEQALHAAENQDADALFEIGGNLYNVCLACHQVYARDQESV